MRRLRRSPGFALTATATLTAGIAATITMFGVYAGVVLHPVTVADPPSLLTIYGLNPHLRGADAYLSWPRFRDLQAKAASYASMAAYSRDTVTLTADDGPAEQLRALRVSGDFFGTLRIGAARGRLFIPGDDQPNGPAVCLLSYELWQGRFGGRDLTGLRVQLDGRSVEAVGVLPARLSPPWADRQIVLPRVFEDSGMPPASIVNGGTFLEVVARVRPGVTVSRARDELRGITIDYAREFAAHSDAANDTAIRPLADTVSDSRRPVLGALLSAVVLVLLVSCANASALVLGRLTAYQRDIAVAQALGARRATVVLDFLRESLALSAVAGVTGVVIAAGALRVIQTALAAELPPGVVLRIEPLALAVAAGVVLLAAVLVGLAPALHATRARSSMAITAFVRGMSDTRATRRFRNGLVICEVALSVLLVVGAALVLASLTRLHRASPGFDPSGVAAAYVTLPPGRYPSPQEKAAFFIDVADRLAAAPQIAGAAIVFGLPFDDNYSSPYAIAGRPLLPVAERARAGLRIVSERYFDVMRIRVAAGRTFTPADRIGSQPVCLVNQSLARRQFGSEQAAVGQVILRGREAAPYEIVGVVTDVKTNGLVQPAPDEVFYAFRQAPRPNATLVARTSGDPERLAPLMQSAVAAVDRAQPLFGFASMDRRLETTLGPQRILAGLTLAFSALAMLLASIGLYAVLAHSVVLRTNEIGIRVAIGAGRAAIVRLILVQGLRLVGAGIGSGLAAAALASPLLAPRLFDVNPRDPLLYGGVALLFAAIGLIASLAPAIRASRVDPIVSLSGS